MTPETLTWLKRHEKRIREFQSDKCIYPNEATLMNELNQLHYHIYGSYCLDSLCNGCSQQNQVIDMMNKLFRALPKEQPESLKIEAQEIVISPQTIEVETLTPVDNANTTTKRRRKQR